MSTLAQTDDAIVGRIEAAGERSATRTQGGLGRHLRTGAGHRAHARHAALRRPRAADRRAGPRQDAAGRDARQNPGARCQAHPVHARPDAVRHHRLGGAGGQRRRAAQLPLHQGADLRPAADGGRDQPRQPQDAVGAAAGHAGAPRHGRRPAPRRAGAVPRARHPKPARAGRHLSAARSPARPLPAADRRQLSRPGRRAAHAVRHHRHRGAAGRGRSSPPRS